MATNHGQLETSQEQIVNFEVAQGSKIRVYLNIEIAELTPLFLESVKEKTGLARLALNQKDFLTLINIGHILMGEGGSYGFDPITEIGGSLEKAAYQENVCAAGILIDALSDYLSRLEIVYFDY